jgi:hypothetical protein
LYVAEVKKSMPKWKINNTLLFVIGGNFLTLGYKDPESTPHQSTPTDKYI